MTFLELLLVFLKASMLSSGGMQALPLLQEDLMHGRAILTETDFASAVAIGRIKPGPNGLFVISIGYFAAGFLGVVASIIAVMTPSLLGIGLVRAHRRLAGRPWVIGATRGITASAVGLLAALGYSFTLPLLGHPASLAIAGVSLIVLIWLKTDALPLLIVGGLVGIALNYLGVPLA